jgi:hypothetical protein
MASAPARVVNMASVEEQLADVFADIDWCAAARAPPAAATAAARR